VAVKVLAPAVARVRLQVPVATAPVQVVALALSVTVTFPVGVPLAEVTVKLTVTAWPTTEGSGEAPVMFVVVLFRLTVWDSVSLLVTKSPLPA
jgi:hypothetical protein